MSGANFLQLSRSTKSVPPSPIKQPSALGSLQHACPGGTPSRPGIRLTPRQAGWGHRPGTCGARAAGLERCGGWCTSGAQARGQADPLKRGIPRLLLSLPQPSLPYPPQRLPAGSTGPVPRATSRAPAGASQGAQQGVAGHGPAQLPVAHAHAHLWRQAVYLGRPALGHCQPWAWHGQPWPQLPAAGLGHELAATPTHPRAPSRGTQHTHPPCTGCMCASGLAAAWRCPLPADLPNRRQAAPAAPRMHARHRAGQGARGSWKLSISVGWQSPLPCQQRYNRSATRHVTSHLRTFCKGVLSSATAAASRVLRNTAAGLLPAVLLAAGMGAGAMFAVLPS